MNRTPRSEPVEDPPSESSGAEVAALASVVRRAAAGDEGAWSELIGLYSHRVFALAKSRCKQVEMAEEITQSVFVTIAAKLRSGGEDAGRYSEQGRFESWLFRIAMNRIRDEARRVRRHAVATDPAVLPTLAGGAETASADPEMPSLDRLRDAIERLPDADREIVELRHHGQMSFRQMAELLNEPLGTLLARHHRALQKLKSILSDAAGREKAVTS